MALQPDDVLVVYTDGLVERRGETLDEGLGRLRRVALDGPEDLEALANHLLEALLPEEGPSDDVALAVAAVDTPARGIRGRAACAAGRTHGRAPSASRMARLRRL